jgi:hypothetical protein
MVKNKIIALSERIISATGGRGCATIKRDCGKENSANQIMKSWGEVY